MYLCVYNENLQKQVLFFQTGWRAPGSPVLDPPFHVMKTAFPNRITDTWNSLPEKVIPVKTVRHFEIMLDNHWKYRTLAST